MEDKKMKVKNNINIETLDMKDIFKIELVDGKKRVSRWGFFAKQKDGSYAIFKPETAVCAPNELFDIEDDGPGCIQIVNRNEIQSFVNAISHTVRGVPAMNVNDRFPCGWYYDTLTA